MRRFAPVAACFAAVAAFCALSFSQTSGEAKKLSLVYNVNNAGYIDVCGCKHKEVRQGSLTRRASFLKQLRATGRDLLLLDGGSSLFALEDRVKDSERDEAVRKAQLIVEAYNRMGYRAMAVGVSDLAAGLDTLLELRGKAKFTFLSANVIDKATGKSVFEPTAILEVEGVRVGVFGLTLNTMSPAYLGKVAPGIEVTDPLAAATRAMAELKGKVDLVVALSHLREETNFELCDKLKDLEVLIDPCIQYGNHHTWLKDESEWVAFRGDTLFLRTDGQGARLGVVDLEIRTPRAKLAYGLQVDSLAESVAAGTATPEEKAEYDRLKPFNRFAFTRVSLEPHHRSDPEMDQLIDDWKKNIDLSKVVHLEADLPRKTDFLTVDKCKGCHEKQYENWKTTKHSHALASLVQTNDQHRYDCIGCHSLGYGEAFLDTSKIGSFADVQCESCHGTNPRHADSPKEHPYRRTTKNDCLVCHNKEQTLNEFNFAQSKPAIQCPKG